MAKRYRSASERFAIQRQLRAGLTPDQIQARFRNRARAHEIYLTAIEEEARLEKTYRSIIPTPDSVARLRENGLRWERIAVRVFGEPRWVIAAKALYDHARGRGAARHSYTGRGRRYPAMRD